jgi:hypothetical protein
MTTEVAPAIDAAAAAAEAPAAAPAPVAEAAAPASAAAPAAAPAAPLSAAEALKIRQQVEFYFSDSNAPRDKFLLSKIEADPEVRRERR